MLHFSIRPRVARVVSPIVFAVALSAVCFQAFGAEDENGAFALPVEIPVNDESIVRQGIAVDFSASPARPDLTGEEVKEGDYVTVQFRIEGAEDRKPLQGVYPGVWIDLVQTADGQKKGTARACRDRVGTYLQGTVGMRPLIDLNSYFVLVLNQGPSISVIDPVVGITGITSLYTSIELERPGADWAKLSNEKRLFVSMPRAGKIAVVDLDTFKVVKNLPAGELPMRVALQPDERYLWVGNDAAPGDSSGVTVIDLLTDEIVARIPTGDGHHEITFSADSRRAFVTNRGSGTLTVIDTRALEVMSQIEAGEVPISVAYSALSDAAYVADGASGVVIVIDPESGLEMGRINLSSGIGPMRFSRDGRWGFLANPGNDTVHVIDAATNELAHSVEISGRPFQISVTDTFAYVRSLDSERVSMINLQELNRNGDVIINNFAAGSYPPGQVSDIRLADTMTTAAQEAAILVVSPADATVYYYMEGMNAPMGAFRNYGHKPRSVQIANRALKEVEPGLYQSTFKVPMAGTFEVAFLNEAPQFMHCFTMEAKVNPALDKGIDQVAVEYLGDRPLLQAGDKMSLRFRLINSGSGKVLEEAGPVTVKYFRSPRFDLNELVATPLGDGVYEAVLSLRNAGAYYIYVAAPGLDADYADLNYTTVVVSRKASQSSTTGGGR